MLHLWYALPGVRSRKAFVIFFISFGGHTISGQPLFHSEWIRLRRGLFLWHYFEETEQVRWAERENQRSRRTIAARSRWVLPLLMAAGQDWSGKRIGLLSVLLLIVLLSGQRWACWGAAYLCLRSSFSATVTVSKTPCTGSRGKTIHFLKVIMKWKFNLFSKCML